MLHVNIISSASFQNSISIKSLSLVFLFNTHKKHANWGSKWQYHHPHLPPLMTFIGTGLPRMEESALSVVVANEEDDYHSFNF